MLFPSKLCLRLPFQQAMLSSALRGVCLPDLLFIDTVLGAGGGLWFRRQGRRGDLHAIDMAGSASNQGAGKQCTLFRLPLVLCIAKFVFPKVK